MPAGRPSKMTPERVKKLEDAFLWGCNDTEACLYADISRQTLHNYQEKHPEFIDRKERLKTNPLMMAKRIQFEDLVGSDSTIAQKVIDRKEGKKIAVTGEDGGPLITKIQYEVVNAEDSSS